MDVNVPGSTSAGGVDIVSGGVNSAAVLVSSSGSTD